jgi:hypothetical protein
MGHKKRGGADLKEIIAAYSGKARALPDNRIP